jgi:hypothetical protein
MKKLSGLIVGLSLAVAAPIASAFPDPLYLQPEVGGAEITYAVKVDQTGINAATNSDSFWYAGTSGVPSN